MRFLVSVVVAATVAAGLCAAARAQPAAGPPSKTFERAIKLYDRQDFYSASIELKKVLDGETGDDAANKQRAWFFMAKTLYQMKYHVAALAYFDRIATDPSHTYREPSIKWLVALAEVVPGDASTHVFGSYAPNDADAPVFDDKTRDGFRYHLAQQQAQKGSSGAATALLHAIAATSEWRGRAALELGILAFQAQKPDDAIAALRAAAADPATTEEAVRTLAGWTRRLGSPQKAREPLQALAAKDAYAALENSRLALEGTSGAMSTVAIESFDAVAIATACRKPTSGDARAAVNEMIRDARARVAKLRTYDDNAEAYDAMRMQRDVAVISIAVSDRTVREQQAFVAELTRELEMLQRSDKAWQTTQIAAEILQELTVQMSVAAADLGKLYLERLKRLDKDLEVMARYFAVRDKPLGLGASGDIVVRPELCRRVTGAVVHVAANGPEPQPIATPPPHAKGCGGCASGSSGASAFAMIAIVLLAARRRSARR